ncbi:TlpA disulfide reductase family protein [Tenacibaculum aquimarinum]|uniref:TlpA disulfide reductase family protein n=1 Tax=Tenacibaculum aquimarinum TaxID=2910675 RepID=UPI001F0AB3F8|nr:TlpA disulfide reductase family protein [Tenacibaculum aquimarinum]MCH3884719.1 TlpA family protein disulfide reductase [Tenacibaculum aquimarinum]
MKNIVYFLIASFLLLGCEPVVKSYNYDGLKPLLNKVDDKVYVVNFWATWCAPCVKELPAFEKIKSDFATKNVEVLLVSLDFPKQVDKRLIPFIEKNEIQSKVVLLDDTNEQRWISEIDKDWSGSLPATLIYSKNKRKFYEQSFDYKTLENEVNTFLN